MTPDMSLYHDVIHEFVRDAQLQPNEIGISVRGRVAILTGYTDSHSKRSIAEQVAKNVCGIKGVVNDIQVRLPNCDEYTDADVACMVVQVLEQCTNVSLDGVKVVVRDGWITLEGAVDRYDQCEEAEEAVRGLSGMIGVTNRIIVRPNVTPEDIRARIEEAFQNNPEIDARSITVEVCGSNVLLRGQVRSCAERAAAWRSACRAPGVASIENQIEVAL